MSLSLNLDQIEEIIQKNNSQDHSQLQNDSLDGDQIMALLNEMPEKQSDQEIEEESDQSIDIDLILDKHEKNFDI